jgi:AcrR family transcriptional regulator
MPPQSTLKPVIMEKAILLFGEKGRHGVSIEHLAQAAHVTRASVYRLCKSMKKLHQEALDEMTLRVHEELSKALVSIKNQDARYYARKAVREWHRLLPQPAARFLHQVMVEDKKQYDKAYGPIGQIITALTAVLESNSKGKAAVRASDNVENLILALFHYKVTHPSAVSQKEESAKVDSIIESWLAEVFPEQ